VQVVIVYESLTGTTARAARIIGDELTRAGAIATVCPVTAIDYQALSDAELVVVGTWTDGIFVVGQRPGRAARLRAMPVLAGKLAVVYCTYAIDSGRTLEKLIAIVEERGAEVVGGMTIRRDRVAPGATEFAARVLEAVSA
jgi:hypothetical protein